MERKFLEHIHNSESILITSHISPDPDAVCSTLLLGLTLKKNFFNKKITMALEEGITELSWLNGYDRIKFGPLNNSAKNANPDLVIIVDAMNFDRCTRIAVDELKATLGKSMLVIIDHHSQIGVEHNDLYINRQMPAATQEIYELLFNDLKLAYPDGYADISMLGIYSDTHGFIYPNKHHRQTFNIASDLLDQGVSIEKIYNRTHRYTDGQMKVLAELASNVVDGQGYSYTYISDDFFNNWPRGTNPAIDIKRACDIFLNEYIRNIGDRFWGFIVRKDPLDHGYYRVSFRAQTATKNVSEIAKIFSGGGHKYAAGGKVPADTIQEAIGKVQIALGQSPR